MKTIGSALLLVVFGVIASFLAGIVLNIAGLPGTLLAGTPGHRSKRRLNLELQSRLLVTHMFILPTPPLL
jgi:hypothetical protein